MSNDFDQFRETYINECLELLAQMEEGLLALDEAGTASLDELNAIFRCAHSIKGGAGAFGFNAIANFTHILEALLDKMREGEMEATPEIINQLLQSRDIVLQMVEAAHDGKTLPDDFGSEVSAALQAICDGGGSVSSSTPASSVVMEKNEEPAVSGKQKWKISFVPHEALMASGNEPLLLMRELMRLGKCTITCNTDKLPTLAAFDPECLYLSWQIECETEAGEAAIREVFEFVEDECELHVTPVGESAPKPEAVATSIAQGPAAQPAKAAQNKAGASSSAAPPATSIRVDIDKVDRLINMVGEIVITQAMLAMSCHTLNHQEHNELLEGINNLTTHTRELQEAVMAVRMQPVRSIFARMPRLVRDLSASLGKLIKLEMSGESTEVDKTIIEQLADPLTHMIRNAVDHGIETPQEREAKGKPEMGTIRLSASHRGGRIVIEVNDDGGGINRERVLAKALEKGIVEPGAKLSDHEIDQLIFAPGFSTAAQVTDVSGRGVGMDVVKKNIESLGGAVIVSNAPGEGTLLTISLPLTLAILDGMVVRVATERYIMPIASIIETMRPKKEEVGRMSDGTAIINIRGEFVPLIPLHRLFGIEGAENDPTKALVILAEKDDSTVGVIVDELIGQQQVVIKSLEENSAPIIGVSGATILGDGRVSLILDVAGLCQLKPGKVDREREAA